MITRTRVNGALVAVAFAAGVGLLAGCSTSPAAAPMDLTGSAPRPGTTQTARSTVGDDPADCYQFGQGTNGAQGWTCNYTGDTATITVPSNATGIQVSMSGGEGGESNPASPGYGTAVTGTWPVSGGQTLSVTVGQGASDQTAGGGAAAGGAGGNSQAGGGGGASAVEVNGRVIAVAGGGGGGGAQGAFPKIDDGGAGGTSSVDNGDGHGGSGPGSGDSPAGGNGPALAKGYSGGGGHHGGGAGGGGGGGWGAGNGGPGGSWGAGGGAGGAAGGSYVSTDGQATTMAQANRGGDGIVTITWLLS